MHRVLAVALLLPFGALADDAEEGRHDQGAHDAREAAILEELRRELRASLQEAPIDPMEGVDDPFEALVKSWDAQRDPDDGGARPGGAGRGPSSAHPPREPCTDGGAFPVNLGASIERGGVLVPAPEGMAKVALELPGLPEGMRHGETETTVLVRRHRDSYSASQVDALLAQMGGRRIEVLQREDVTATGGQLLTLRHAGWCKWLHAMPDGDETVLVVGYAQEWMPNWHRPVEAAVRGARAGE